MRRRGGGHRAERRDARMGRPDDGRAERPLRRRVRVRDGATGRVRRSRDRRAVVPLDAAGARVPRDRTDPQAGRRLLRVPVLHAPDAALGRDCRVGARPAEEEGAAGEAAPGAADLADQRRARELALHSVERGDGDRLVGFALSEGSMRTLLEAGVSEEEVGLDRLRAAAAAIPEAVPWWIAYRVWLGLE